MKDGDVVLIVWLLGSLLWDVSVFAAVGYIVFWRGRSGWWFIFAIALTYSETLFKALCKRFDLPKEN